MFKESIKLKWNFQGFGGTKQKTFNGEGVDIVWNNTIHDIDNIYIYVIVLA